MAAMVKTAFALALILILVALCTRKPMEEKIAERLPNTCATLQFGTATDAFESLSLQRDDVLKRVEALRTDEPLEYVLQLRRDVDALRSLATTAEGTFAPRCLDHAKELMVKFLDDSARALELRVPDKEPVDYERARDVANNVRSQYFAEVKLQEKNRQ